MTRADGQGLEQRFDRWVETGRQLVDGVAGARPGTRSGARGAGRRPGPRLNPGELGRWVEDKLEWLLDDEGDADWREPWQTQSAQAADPAPSPRARSARRRPLEAISRRGRTPSTPSAPAGDWPDDDSFSLNRWQRPSVSRPDAGARDTAPQPEGRQGQGRALPRSSRLRVRR